jgi:hypothetical protein
MRREAVDAPAPVRYPMSKTRAGGATARRRGGYFIQTKFFLRLILPANHFGERGAMSHQGTALEAERKGENHRPALWSDDECVQRLAVLIKLRNSRDLGKIASLIGRLAVPVV